MRNRCNFEMLSTLGVGCLALFLASACGSEDPGNNTDSGAPIDLSEPLLPFAEGNSWTYRVTESGNVSTKVQTVGEEEQVGGTGPNKDEMAFRVTTDKDGDQTLSWQAVDGERVVRYREQAFHAMGGDLELEEHWDPYKLRVDYREERMEEGTSWVEEYDETKIPVDANETTVLARDVWTVVSLNEPVSVPAGDFDSVMITKAGGEALKTYWFVPGIGKVKETGGQVEELESYEVDP